MSDLKKAELIQRKKEAISKLPQYAGEVASKNNLRSLPNTKEGEIYWVTLDEKPYIIAEKKDGKITIKALDETATISTGMTIYELNHNIVAKEPLFDWSNEAAVWKLDESLQHWFLETTKETEFYLLYGRDIHYVTVIRKTATPGNLLENLKEMIEEFAELISMDVNTDGDEHKIEIWVRHEHNPAELLYFFPYDDGLAEI